VEIHLKTSAARKID